MWTQGKDMPIIRLLEKMSTLTKKLAELEMAKSSAIAVGQVRAFAQETRSTEAIEQVEKLLREQGLVRDG